MKGFRILLVEDQLELRELIGMTLMELGIGVVSVQDGLGAKSWILADGGFDAVLSDINLPDGISGIALADFVARIMPHAKMILTSGCDRGQLPALPRDVTFLPKPFRLKELVALLKAVACHQADAQR